MGLFSRRGLQWFLPWRQLHSIDVVSVPVGGRRAGSFHGSVSGTDVLLFAIRFTILNKDHLTDRRGAEALTSEDR